MWARHPNIHLETSYYQVHQGLSDIARRFGFPACLSFVSMRLRTGQIPAWHNGPRLPKSR